MEGKKGQFYLLAAIIIITLIVGFVTIQNYSYKKSSVKLYDLGEELGIESQNVIDYGTYDYLDETAMNSLLENFMDTYTDYAGAGKNLYFLFGNSSSIIIKAYQELDESVSIDGDDIEMTNGHGEKMHAPSEEIVVVKIGDIEYQFNLGEEQKFYFVVSQEIEGEKYIVTG